MLHANSYVCAFLYFQSLNSRQIERCLQCCDSTELVPGDIIAVEGDTKLPCDGILLLGTALVDESMMTGEAKPTYKVGIPALDEEDDWLFRLPQHSKHFLYGGTEVKTAGNLCGGGPALCLVARTGFSSEQVTSRRSCRTARASMRHLVVEPRFLFFTLVVWFLVFTFFSGKNDARAGASRVHNSNKFREGNVEVCWFAGAAERLYVRLHAV